MDPEIWNAHLKTCLQCRVVAAGDELLRCAKGAALIVRLRDAERIQAELTQVAKKSAPRPRRTSK